MKDMLKHDINAVIITAKNRIHGQLWAADAYVGRVGRRDPSFAS